MSQYLVPAGRIRDNYDDDNLFAGVLVQRSPPYTERNPTLTIYIVRDPSTELSTPYCPFGKKWINLAQSTEYSERLRHSYVPLEFLRVLQAGTPRGVTDGIHAEGETWNPRVGYSRLLQPVEDWSKWLWW